MSLRKAYVDGAHGQIHLRIANARIDAAKPPLICLHQSPKSGLEFDTFMRVASRDRMLVAPDYPGYCRIGSPCSIQGTISVNARVALKT